MKAIPNPNRGEFQIQIESEVLGIHDMEIFDLLGRKVDESSFDKVLSNQDISVSLLTGKGMYLVKISDAEGNRKTIKVLVK